MNKEVRAVVIVETLQEMMRSMCESEYKIIMKCAETLECAHSRETIARRLMHDSALWNEVWPNAKEKQQFWMDYMETQKVVNYAYYLKNAFPRNE